MSAQVRVVPTPNTALKAHKKDFARIYIAFNPHVKPNSSNTAFHSGDVAVADVPHVIARALQQLRIKKFTLV